MSLFNELKRRNVFKVTIAYIVMAWLAMQVADVILNNIAAPGWVFHVLLLFLVIGIPFAVFFAWAFELTPEGLKRDHEVDRTHSITPKTGRKLDFLIIGVLVLSLGYFAYDKFILSEGRDAALIEATTQVISEQAVTVEAPTQTDKSIAVLPFANRSNLENDLFFTDGIHDDLLTQLAKIRDFKVISRTSVMEYRDTTKKISEIAAELGVATILEGGIQRAGSRVRINAQLINVATDEHLWAETYDREMTIENLFDIQSDITRQIVAAVKLELTDEEEQSLAILPTNNLEAYESLLHARAAINRADYTAEKFIAALPWAERAVALDARFTEGWAILTEIHGQLFWIGYDSTAERVEMARQALARTLALGRGTAAGHAAQAAWYYRIEWDFRKALEEYQQVLAITPNDTAVLVYTALTQRRVGLWQESIETFKQTLEVDPANVWAMAQMSDTLVWMNEWSYLDQRLDEWILRFPDSKDLKFYRVLTLLNLGDVPAARATLDAYSEGAVTRYHSMVRKLLRIERDFESLLEAIDPPGAVSTDPAESVDFTIISQLYQMGRALHLQGKETQAQIHFGRALTAAEKWKPREPNDEASRLTIRAHCQAYLGRFDAALMSSLESLALQPLERDHVSGTIFQRAHTFVLALTGQRDEALERIAANIDAPEGFSRWELYLEPEWDFFRNDERFNELVRPEGVP